MRVRFGIMGCARIVATALLDPARRIEQIEIAAIASRSIDKARAFGAEHGIPCAYGDYQSVLEDPTIDAVYIPLPNNLHAAWTERALASGKAVLCEKPLTSNALEAQRVAQAASASGKVLMEAFHYRYHPMARLIGEILTDGRLGAINSVEAQLNIPGKLVPRDDIRFELGLSGGALMDVGAYCVNSVRFATGAEPSVISAAAELVRPGVDGAMCAELEFTNGARGRIECSLTAERMASKLEIVGERGRLRAANPFLPHMGNRLELVIDGMRSERIFQEETSYCFQAHALVAAVHGDARAVLTDAEDGVRNMKLIDAIYRKAGLAPRGG